VVLGQRHLEVFDGDDDFAGVDRLSGPARLIAVAVRTDMREHQSAGLRRGRCLPRIAAGHVHAPTLRCRSRRSPLVAVARLDDEDIRIAAEQRQARVGSGVAGVGDGEAFRGTPYTRVGHELRQQPAAEAERAGRRRTGLREADTRRTRRRCRGRRRPPGISDVQEPLQLRGPARTRHPCDRTTEPETGHGGRPCGPHDCGSPRPRRRHRRPSTLPAERVGRRCRTSRSSTTRKPWCSTTKPLHAAPRLRPGSKSRTTTPPAEPVAVLLHRRRRFGLHVFEEGDPEPVTLGP
jgi:hypothetical protein